MTNTQFSQSMVFHGINFYSKSKEAAEFDINMLGKLAELEDSFCWIDIQSKDINDLYHCLSFFNNNLNLGRHFDEPEILPRIIERDDCLVFFLYEIMNPEKHLDTSHELSIIKFARMVLILSSNYVVSFHYAGISAVDYVKNIAINNFKLAGKTPAFIIFIFLQRCLHDYANLNLANDNYLDKIEFSVLRGKQHEIERKISTSGLNILTLKKLTTNLSIILMLLVTKINPFISQESTIYFREMLSNAVMTRNTIDSSRVLLDGIVAGVQANASSRTREIVRILTVISAIFLPLTLITGIYGMNFIDIPGKALHWGFQLILGGMLLLLSSMLATFYYLGWIGNRKKSK